MFARSSSSFDKLLDKATSHLNLEPDWAAILQICDCIRQGDVLPKYAINAIKKKLYDPNPRIVIYAIQLLESCVKNCGTAIHVEVTARSFMEEIRELIKLINNDNAKAKLLELLQTWAHAFRNEPKYRAVSDTVTLLKLDGLKFPLLVESDLMFSSDQAPDWEQGDRCHRCRVQFSMILRRHHCRNCGQIFCGRCSAKTSHIPRFGIEKDVRVCDPCFDSLNEKKKKLRRQKNDIALEEQLNRNNLIRSMLKQMPSNVAKSEAEETSPKEIKKMDAQKKEDELREEEELQLVLALSQSEAEHQEKTKKMNSFKSQPTAMVQEKIPSSSPVDSELAYYLNRDYWEQKQKEVSPTENRTSPQPSAPINHTETVKLNEKYQNGDVDSSEQFLATLRSTVEIFINRMQSNSSRGRPIANDTYVQALFSNLTNMHAQLFKNIHEQDESRAHYESLQESIARIRDARAALDELRADHREKLRRAAIEADQIRQAQMAQKLEIMRKQKQEYLEYQRQLALQKMHEQELQIRHEQQKHQYQNVYQPPVIPPYVTPVQPMYQPPPTAGNYPPHAFPPPYQPAEQYNLPPNPQTSVYNMQGMMNAMPQSGDMPPHHYPLIGQQHPQQHSQASVAPAAPQQQPMPPASVAAFSPIPMPPTSTGPPPPPPQQQQQQQEACLISFD